MAPSTSFLAETKLPDKAWSMIFGSGLRWGHRMPGDRFACSEEVEDLTASLVSRDHLEEKDHQELGHLTPVVTSSTLWQQHQAQSCRPLPDGIFGGEITRVRRAGQFPDRTWDDIIFGNSLHKNLADRSSVSLSPIEPLSFLEVPAV